MIHYLPMLTIAAGVAFLVVWYEVLPKDGPSYALNESILQGKGTSQVFISARELNDLMTNSSRGVTVLDARDKHDAFVARTKPGSGKSIPGEDSYPWPHWAK